MTVGELIAELEDVDSCIEVRIASQPRWPFEYSLQGVYLVVADDAKSEEEADPEISASAEEEETPIAERPVIYLAEGNQLGYLPSYVNRAIGWK